MTTLRLGTEPGPFVLDLPTGSDFDATMRAKDATGTAIDWPAGTVWSLVFGDGTEWTATTSGSDATFAEDKAAADQIEHGMSVKLRYVNGSTDRIYWIGKVVRYG